LCVLPFCPHFDTNPSQPANYFVKRNYESNQIELKIDGYYPGALTIIIWKIRGNEKWKIKISSNILKDVKKMPSWFLGSKSIVQFNFTFNIKRYLSEKSVFKSLKLFWKEFDRNSFPPKMVSQVFISISAVVAKLLLYFFVIVSWITKD
jgi:hypothetical protein